MLLREDAVVRDPGLGSWRSCPTCIRGSVDGILAAWGQVIGPRVSSSEPPLGPGVAIVRTESSRTPRLSPTR
jgi:hypothetical protein